MKIREDLHPIDKGNRRYELPPASYNLTHDEKKAINFPQGSMIEGYNIEKVIECCLGYLMIKYPLVCPFHTFLGGWKGLG